MELTPPIDPDPLHQGGWPQKAAFFYLPKQYLTNVSYRLLQGGRLTDEAAALFGMSAADRDSTDKAFDELVDQFHRAQIQRMEQVPPPSGWMIGADSSAPHALNFDSALTYRIPDLTDDINSARTTFSDQLQQTLGPCRAQIIASAADSFFSQNMDDLQAPQHTIGFAWASESDGTHSLWYAVADARHGKRELFSGWTTNPIPISKSPTTPAFSECHCLQSDLSLSSRITSLCQSKKLLGRAGLNRVRTRRIRHIRPRAGRQ